MQFRNHIFLSRRWERDEKDFLWKLNYLRAIDAPYQILMFPEGTDLTPKSKAKSDAYAETNGLPKLEYTLHPKSRGFIYMLKGLRDYKIDAVYDLTVGYPDNFVPTEVELMKNANFPREIHYHIIRHDASTIPTTDEGIEKWLRERWAEKEERLKYFYDHQRFRNETTEVLAQLSNSETLVNDKDVMANGNGTLVANGSGTMVNGNSTMVSNGTMERESHLALECTSHLSVLNLSYLMLFFSGQATLFVYWSISYWMFAMYLIFSVGLMSYMSFWTDGIDFFVMRHFKKMHGNFLCEHGITPPQAGNS